MYNKIISLQLTKYFYDGLSNCIKFLKKKKKKKKNSFFFLCNIIFYIKKIIINIKDKIINFDETYRIEILEPETSLAISCSL